MVRASGKAHLVGMTQVQLRGLEDALRNKQAALEDVLRKRDGISVERSADPSDEAQFALARELTIRALDRESSLLAAVRAAMQRMADGEYGVCQRCDGEVSAKRLAALPWAPYCIACQEAIDLECRPQETFAA